MLQCLALGARAVFLGRPVLWGLAVGGEEGVHHVLELLRAELELAMALSGCSKLAVSGSPYVLLLLHNFSDCVCPCCYFKLESEHSYSVNHIVFTCLHRT